MTRLPVAEIGTLWLLLDGLIGLLAAPLWRPERNGR